MKLWTHDELHELMEASPSLKEKSDEAHTLPRVNSEEKEEGKLRMMEIYAEAVGCRQAEAAKDFVREVFANMRKGMSLDDFVDRLSEEYIFEKRCHAPAGNNYLCFCGGK